MNADNDQRPGHIAVIMDGNGRWAQQRGLSRTEGHLQGAVRVREAVENGLEFGIRHLTLYAFSTENWQRPHDEVDFLMARFVEFLLRHRPEMQERGIRFLAIGNRRRLPAAVQEELAKTERDTADGEALDLCVAVNYGSRAEIAQACRRLCRDAADGRIRPDEVDERALESRLDTAGLPDPDLLIRTGGEMRLSNFLLWQLSYAEIYVTDTLWPDFGKHEFRLALDEYARRERRFGRLRT